MTTQEELLVLVEQYKQQCDFLKQKFNELLKLYHQARETDGKSIRALQEILLELCEHPEYRDMLDDPEFYSELKTNVLLDRP